MMDDIDIPAVKANVSKMINMGAPEADIDAYLSMKGVSVDQLRGQPVTKAEPVRKGILGTLDYATSQIRGDSAEKGIDELPSQMIPGVGEIKTKMSISADPKGQLDIYKKHFPNEASRTDKNGNIIVTNNGKEYYLNRPGLSEQDATDFGTGALVTLPFAGLGGKVAQGLGVLGRMAGTGVGSGVGSVVQDAASRSSGSEQPISIPRAAASAAFGAGFEGLSPAVSALYRNVIPSPKLFDPVAGTLTAQGRITLEKMGVNPSEISDNLARQFAKEAATAASPKAALSHAQALTLPMPIKLTKGQISGRNGDQMFEDLASKGAYGEGAETTMRGVRGRQQDALAGNAQAIQDRLAGGTSSISHPNDAGELVAGKIQGMSAQKRNATSAAYDAAENAVAGVPQSEMQGLVFNVSRAVATFDPQRVPSVFSAIGRLDKLSGSGGSSSVLLREVEGARKALSALRASNDGVERAAAGDAIKALDGQLDDLFTRSMIQGDQAALDAWKNARANNAEFMKNFRAGDVVEKIAKGEVSPERSVDAIFNSAHVFGGKDTASSLAKVKGLLGEDSQEWNALREAAWLRIMKKAESPSGEISGQKLRTAMNNATFQNRDIMGELFTSEEVKLMKQFTDVADKVTGGIKNTSNTTPAIANMVQKMFASSFVGEGAAAKLMAMPVINFAYKAGMGLKAANTLGAKPLQRAVPPGVVGGLGAVAEREYQN